METKKMLVAIIEKESFITADEAKGNVNAWDMDRVESILKRAQASISERSKNGFSNTQFRISEYSRSSRAIDICKDFLTALGYRVSLLPIQDAISIEW